MTPTEPAVCAPVRSAGSVAFVLESPTPNGTLPECLLQHA